MSSRYSSLYELWTQGIPVQSAKSVGKKAARFRIPESMTPKRPARRHGLIKLTPENLLALVVEVKDPTTNEGYQRKLKHKPVAEMMNAIDQGAFFPPPVCAWDDDEGWVVVDGQHRAMAHALAGKPLLCNMFINMETSQRRQVFRDQRQATRIDANHQTMNEDDPLSRLVQSVVTNKNPDLPYWCEMVRAGAISPNVMWKTMGLWLTKKDTNARGTYAAIRLNKEAVEEIEVLGSMLREALKSPVAYRHHWSAPRIRAVTKLAVQVWVQCETPRHREQALDRWNRVFPKFNWTDHQHLTRYQDILDMLIKKVWNKRLPANHQLYIKN